MTATQPDRQGIDGSEPAADPTPLDGARSLDPARSHGAPITRAYTRLPRWLPPVAVGGLAMGACIYVGLVDPSTTSSAFYPQCTFKALTGLDCPGCGLTRAMHSVVTGHPGRALDHNILIALILPLAVYTYFVWVSRTMFGWELPYVRVSKKVGYVIGPLILVFWVVRNLPWAPFNWLNSAASGGTV
jgi:hypothetical protein